jgi:hypothetical protein
MGRYIGLDVHRDFAQVAVVENGAVTDAAGVLPAGSVAGVGINAAPG